MSKLSIKGRNIVDKLFIQDGYVLDFSNNDFQRFVNDVIEVDIYTSEGYTEYSSKGSKLRQLVSEESNYKVIKLLTELLDYFHNYKLSQGTDFSSIEEKLIKDLKNEIEDLKIISSNDVEINNNLDEIIKEISTRGARFQKMTDDEKLKELSNLIEYLLKDKKAFRTLNFKEYTRNFLSDDDIKKYREELNDFRHSSKLSIDKRTQIKPYEKHFLINFGITIVNHIYEILLLEDNNK